MPKRVDLVHLKTAEALEVEGPRNITRVARKLGVPAETLRKRVRRMASQFSWHYHLNVYHTYLGLKKALVFAEAIPGYENLLSDCMKANDFWLYIDRCYGMNEGCFAMYTVPSNRTDDFESFARQLQDSGAARNVQVFWSTCFQYVHTRSSWFDPASKSWNFPWDQWVKEASKKRKQVQLPITLRDPEDFPIKADKTDLLILKELEKNPIIRMTELAQKIGISQQLAAYHYLRHIQDQNLIESFEISFPYFDKAASDRFVFTLEFDNNETFVNFTSSLLDRPFVRGLGKVLGKNSLIAHLYLPRTEFRKFVDILSNMIRTGLLRSYSYVILDPTQFARQTISYEYFHNKKWTYDHQKHIKKLESLVKTQGLKKKITSKRPD